jgi:NADPH-dependent 2,4-dienoyl-CoA reductase/sulfur reductase-like enzyme/rhodanese-related sulfurtransferase/TusA-related sulfurtransferase
LDSKNKQVKIKNLNDNTEYFLSYDYLVLSPGAKPIKPNIPGLEDVQIFTLKTIPDSEVIKEYVENKKPKTAVVIGGGFIGLEIAENLRQRGVIVKIVEMLDQVMPPMDREMCQFIHQELILNGVCLVLDDGVDSFGRTIDNKPFVKTRSGRIIETNLIFLSIGIKPETTFVKDSNLKLSPKGYIIVNKHMQTSDPYIYAVGDAVQVLNLQTHKSTNVPLAGPANKQGRIAADNIAGRNIEYEGVLGASVVKIFDLTAAFVGLNEKVLKNNGTNYEKVYLHPNNHAGYYPGAVPLAFKLIFEVPSGKILGAQIVGGPGTEKRIDIISTMIKMGGTVFDLEELELTYSPPYGSAKDPINMAGFIASNVIKGDMPIWHWHDLDKIRQQKGLLLDVRTEFEFKTRQIEGAININVDELRKRSDEIPKDRPIYIYCESGFRSYLATRALMQKGFKEVSNLTGGFKLYEMANATTEEIFNACGSPQEIMDELIKEKSKETEDFVEIDASGLSCPGPLNALIKTLEILPEDKKLKIMATDPSFKSSVEAYVKLTDNIKLLSLEKSMGKLVAILQKGKISKDEVTAAIKKPKITRKQIRRLDAPPLSDIEPIELYERFETEDKPDLLIDVRSSEEFYGPEKHIKGAKLIPLGELMNKIEELKEFKDKEIVTICHSGMRSMMAARLLAQAGFKDVRNLVGGMMGWLRKVYPTTRKN